MPPNYRIRFTAVILEAGVQDGNQKENEEKNRYIFSLEVCNTRWERTAVDFVQEAAFAAQEMQLERKKKKKKRLLCLGHLLRLNPVPIMRGNKNALSGTGFGAFCHRYLFVCVSIYFCVPVCQEINLVTEV